jgi:hypothetical protein
MYMGIVVRLQLEKFGGFRGIPFNKRKGEEPIGDWGIKRIKGIKGKGKRISRELDLDLFCCPIVCFVWVDNDNATKAADWCRK